MAAKEKSFQQNDFSKEVEGWGFFFFSFDFFSPFSTLLGARVLKIVLSEFSCYPFWSPDVGSQPAQLVEPKCLADRERLCGLHFILNYYLALYSQLLLMLFLLECQEKMPRLAGLEGL